LILTVRLAKSREAVLLPAEIIKRLGAYALGLTKQKLSRGRYGARQDYLRNQDLIARTRLQTEFAAELLAQPGAAQAQIVRACNEVIAGQMQGRSRFDAQIRTGQRVPRLSHHLQPGPFCPRLLPRRPFHLATPNCPQFLNSTTDAPNSQSPAIEINCYSSCQD
jgi:hypothetical protein